MPWEGAGGSVSVISDDLPEPLTPVNGVTGAAAAELDDALAAFDATIASRGRPVLVFLRRKPNAARLVANPFYLGEAMLPDDVTLGDNDDAVVWFGLGADAGAFVR